MPDLESQLNDFDPKVRERVVRELAVSGLPFPEPKPEVNLHIHTFFSYNAHGWSPSRVAWEARKYGLAVAGIVDFDVLDGVNEFLNAGELLDLRTTAALETRVFLEEYSRHVINSPNEPGITYFMAAGCWKTPEAGTSAARILDSMRQMARRRNVQVMERVNDFLDGVRLDYDRDVLPLTPSGNATERHMLAAYDAKARQILGTGSDLKNFWAEKLGADAEEIEALLADTPKLHEKMRSKLMKYGGVGYVAPTPETFPSVETVIEMAQGIGALPTATWLDGTNPGESDMPAMLALLESKGVVALNIVPDRNWNIKDAEEKRVKVENLGKVVDAARAIGFPLCVGTEMNKAGLPFVDDFSAPELQPYVGDFLDGAYFFWGHTFLARYAGMGYASPWAEAQFGSDRRSRNEFYAKVGRAAAPSSGSRLAGVSDKLSLNPQDILRLLG